MKQQSFSLSFCGLALLLSASSIIAAEKTKIAPLDEELLEFIASMTMIEGNIVDSLDMVDLAENDMKMNITLENKINSEIELNENKSEIVKAKLIKKEKKDE